MKVALWAEIRRLSEMEKLSGWAIARRLHCSRHTVAAALKREAACVENLLLAERRRRQLPTPTLPTPKRRELIDDIELEPADPALYDRFCHDTDNSPQENNHGSQ